MLHILYVHVPLTSSNHVHYVLIVRSSAYVRIYMYIYNPLSFTDLFFVLHNVISCPSPAAHSYACSCFFWDYPATNMTLWVNVSMKWSYNPYTLQFVWSRTCAPGLLRITICVSTAVEVTLSSLRLASRTTTTLSVTWSAGYPKCYSFTVSHSTQDGYINVTQPADSDISHTLTSLQPGTTYRIEVEAVRKGDEADRQRARVIGSFTTESAGEETRL